MSKTKPREIYADILRIIAAFSVVFQHTVTSVWSHTPVLTDDWVALNFFNSIARFGVAVFIMISGAFMLSPKFPHSPQKIFTKNLPRIILLLLFWVILYGIVNTLCSGGNIKDILSTPILLFTKPQIHLWFLYTIAGLYILTPPLRIFTEHASHKMVLYVIGIFFFFGLVLPTTNHLLQKLAHFTLYKNIGIQGCTSFAGFYLTGFYLSHYELNKNARKILYLLAFLSWFATFSFSTYFSISKSTPNEFFLGNFRPMTFLMAAGIFCWFKNHYKNKQIHSQLITRVSACMLGVYLIHPLFIRLYHSLKFSLLNPHPLITIPIIAGLFFAISFITVYILRLIPGLKKVI